MMNFYIYTFSETEMSFFKVTGASVWEIVCLTRFEPQRVKEACSAPFGSQKWKNALYSS